MSKRDSLYGCGDVSRRTFLADTGMGFTGLALGAMLHRDGIARASENGAWSPPDGRPHFAPKAKSVIWFFMIGGVSHMESFDPKPALDQHAGKSIEETPYKGALDNPLVTENLESGFGRKLMGKLFPLQKGYRKRGESGIEVSDWFPHVGDCIDDIAVVRSMWTTDNNHGAQLQFHTGRNKAQGIYPTIGSWVHYGLGSLNDNLPQYVVLGQELGDCCGGLDGHGAAYLGPSHTGVQLATDPANPLPFLDAGGRITRSRQIDELELLGQLNRMAAAEYPSDPALEARIKSYELAFRMQMAVPEVVDVANETAETQSLYGVDDEVTREFGGQCLVARRLVDRGTRFVQIFHGSTNGAGRWDAHRDLETSYNRNCPQVDKPIAGLLKDLKRRGLLDETLVVFATEFGRTPGVQNAQGGRDHHPYGFSVWMAGGGIKGGIAHGATDEIGFHAVEDRHYVTDVHATILQQLGLDPRRLEVPGRKRLDIDFGSPIREIIS